MSSVDIKKRELIKKSYLLHEDNLNDDLHICTKLTTAFVTYIFKASDY